MSEPIEVTLDYYIKKCDKLEKKLAEAEIRIKRTTSAAYHALLEISGFLGIPEHRREDQVNYLMENVKFCAETNLTLKVESEGE